MEREIRKRAPKKAPGHPVTNVDGESRPRNTTGQPCKTCKHPNRELAERMILEGAPFKHIERDIAIGDRSVDPTDPAIKYHAQRCIPDIMARRIEKIQEPDNITADLVMRHLRESLEQAESSAEICFETDEHDVIREAAQGRSAAIRTRIEAARAAGEVIGMFNSRQVELLLRMPETQELLARIVEAVCPECAVKVRTAIAGEEKS